MSRDQDPAPQRSAPSHTWDEVDELRSATLPLAGQQSTGYSTWLRGRRRLRDRFAANARGEGLAIPRPLLIVAGAVVLTLVAGVIALAFSQSSLRDALDLLLIVLYFVAAIVAIPLLVALAVFLLRLPGRALGALRRR